MNQLAPAVGLLREPGLATGLYDMAILQAALSQAMKDPAQIMAVIDANGDDFKIDFAENRALRSLTRHLMDLRERGLAYDREIAASVIAESIGTEGPADREAVAQLLADIAGRGNPGAFPLFLQRLRSLRLRRRLTMVGEKAQNGCSDANLLAMVQAAVLEQESSGDELTFADLTGPVRPAPPALVGGVGKTLIVSGDKVGIVGSSGDGKTQLLSAIAVAIAAGRDVLDMQVQQQPVLYVSSDDDPDLLRKIQRHAAGLGVDLAGLPLRVVNDPDFNLDEPGTLAKVRKALKGLGADTRPATFIIETLTTNVSSETTDLHSAVSVRAYIRRTLSALQTEFPGLTCIISHHFKKPQAGGANDMSSRVSGSVQIKAGVDCLIGISGDGAEAFKVRTLKRSRSGAKFDAFKVRIVGDEGAPLTLRNEGTVDISEAELHGASAAVVAFLKDAGIGKVRLLSDIKAGIPKTKFRDRAIESACKKLSEGDDAILERTGKKPASYAYQPPKQTASDLEGLD
jgi:hypothetical protein